MIGLQAFGRFLRFGSPAALGGPAADGSSGKVADAEHVHDTSGLPVLLTVRHSAGVPTGAPTGTELPYAVDTTASPGTAYFWDGAAWNATV
jgi:hypothetical protein